jgi:hypothetical protein
VRQRFVSRQSKEVRAEPFAPHAPFGSPQAYEAWLWNELCLGLVGEVTRNVPEWFDDDEIADALREARRQFSFPWELQ